MIQATITSVCGAAITITREILVGGLELNQVSITESAPPCPNGYVEYEAIVPGRASDYDFTWRIPQGWTLTSQFTPNKIGLTAPNTIGAGGILYVDIDDGCDVLTKSRTIWVAGSCLNATVKVYPNPTNPSSKESVIAIVSENKNSRPTYRLGPGGL